MCHGTIKAYMNPIQKDKILRLVVIFIAGVFVVSGAAYLKGQELAQYVSEEPSDSQLL